jgi:hypothetical protein
LALSRVTAPFPVAARFPVAAFPLPMFSFPAFPFPTLSLPLSILALAFSRWVLSCRPFPGWAVLSYQFFA